MCVCVQRVFDCAGFFFFFLLELHLSWFSCSLVNVRASKLKLQRHYLLERNHDCIVLGEKERERESRIARKKSRKFPIKAKPSDPIKIAMTFDMKNPENIFIKTETEFNEATLTSTLSFMSFNRFFN